MSVQGSASSLHPLLGGGDTSGQRKPVLDMAHAPATDKRAVNKSNADDLKKEQVVAEVKELEKRERQEKSLERVEHENEQNTVLVLTPNGLGQEGLGLRGSQIDEIV